jgi:ABC-type cobalamin/Fe3+-siderophores transport system ATPase subunit
MDVTLTLPGGEQLPGDVPVVVIGPNGSGKTRQTRQITAPTTIDFINALRNTRVAPELPAVGVDTARNNFNSQRAQTRTNHWELAGEFDYMLSQLLAQHSMSAIEFARAYRENPAGGAVPAETALHLVENLWSEVFPGRELHWSDWKPVIKNRSTGAELTYSGNQMSDGEKAALYLAGRVFSADPGVLVVDEPETHLHSLLASRLWNVLQEARPDIRFVYVTHDLNFAMSRQDAIFVLASPTAGLRALDLGGSLPDDVAEALLGSASLSFFASRVVFCEGESSSLDSQLFEAWFNGPDTVVKAVASCQRVIRCVEAVSMSGIAAALTAVGLVDGDYHPEAFRSVLPAGLTMLKLHEVESLLSDPDVVSAVCAHLAQSFDRAIYRECLLTTVTDDQVRRVAIERWKRRLEPYLEGLVSGVSKKQESLSDLTAEIPQIFDHKTWAFSPEQILEEERVRVEGARSSTDLESLLAIFPGKQMLPVAAKQAGLQVPAYLQLILAGLQGKVANEFGSALEVALAAHLPSRHAPVKAIPTPI